MDHSDNKYGQERSNYTSLDPNRLRDPAEFSFVVTSNHSDGGHNNGGHNNGFENQEEYYEEREDDTLQDKLNQLHPHDEQSYYEEGYQEQRDFEYEDETEQVYQQYQVGDEESYERQKEEIIDDLQSQSIVDESEQDQASLYTLEDTPNHHQPNEQHVYDLPTHISSHHDVLQQRVSTQPSTPVSEPFIELPSHRLRPLSQTNLSSHAGGDLQETLDTPLALPLKVKGGKDEDWDEKGAAKLIQKTTNAETGEEEELVIKRSVKDFKFGKNIGFGSYSTVVLATDKNTSKNFAVKVLDKRHIIKEKKVKYVNIEKNTLNRLGARSGIVRLFFTFQDESSLYFVLDYAANGELLNLIKEYGSLTEETTKYYAAQILDAVKYMHDNGVIHRDLKPENILLDENMKVQITDFGTAKLLEKSPQTGQYPLDTRAKSFVGTAEYVSPELLNEKAIGKSCDVWAFGCILYQMIAGKPPFKATNEYLTFQKIVKLQYAFTAGFPMVIRDLIKKILVLNPANRSSVRLCMKHLFFQGIDFNDPQQVWGIDPPEVKGPYKINAKSMLPVPELSSGALQKTRINLPRRVTSQPATTNKRNVSDPAQQTPPASASFSPVITPTSTTPKPITASQQVLQRAKEKVAARKAAQVEERQAQYQDNQQNVIKAASAATVALGRQPNEIIKQVNEQKELKRAAELEESAVSSRKVSSSGGTTASTSASATSTRLKKPAPVSTSAPLTPPMQPADIKYSQHLDFKSKERVLDDGPVTLYHTTVDVLSKKYKGKLKDITNASNTLLSQVANGSYRGLRNMDRYGEEVERSIITEYDQGSYGYVNDDEFFRESRGFKFKKFFNVGSSSGDGRDSEEEGDGLRARTLVVTNQGRCLFLQRVKNEKDEASLALRVEIDLSHPVIKIKELSSSSENLTPSQNIMKGFFVIESYQRAFVVECYKSDVSKWCRVIAQSKAFKDEKMTSSSSSSSTQSSSAQSSVRGLGINTTNTSSTTTTNTTNTAAALRKPSSGQARSASQSSVVDRSSSNNQSSHIKSPKQYNAKSPTMPHQPAQNTKPRLFHGLPLPQTSPTSPATQQQLSRTSSSSSSNNNNMLTNAAKLAIAAHPQNHGANPGNLPQTEKKQQVTGMTSRMLSRSLGNKKR